MFFILIFIAIKNPKISSLTAQSIAETDCLDPNLCLPGDTVGKRLKHHSSSSTSPPLANHTFIGIHYTGPTNLSISSPENFELHMFIFQFKTKL